MRKVKRPKLGEYVLLARWSDKSLHDPWEIGFLKEVKEHVTRGISYRVDRRWFRNCWRITQKEAEQRFEDSKAVGEPIRQLSGRKEP